MVSAPLWQWCTCGNKWLKPLVKSAADSLQLQWLRSRPPLASATTTHALAAVMGFRVVRVSGSVTCSVDPRTACRWPSLAAAQSGTVARKFDFTLCCMRARSCTRSATRTTLTGASRARARRTSRRLRRSTRRARPSAPSGTRTTTPARSRCALSSPPGSRGFAVLDL